MRSSLIAALVTVVIAWGVCAAPQKPACPSSPELKIWGSLDAKPKIAEGYNPDKVVIGIGSYKLLEISGAAAGYTLSEREVAVYNRLTEALSHGPLKPEDICVGMVRSAPTIYVGPVRFISVYVKDAAAAKMTQDQLAQVWRGRLAEVLPRITSGATYPLTMPEGAKMPAPAAGAPLSVYDVAIGGISLFRLRDKDGFDSLAARGLAVEAQIVQMLSDGKKPVGLKAQAVKCGETWMVVYGDVRVVTVTSGDAAANVGSTTESLAKAWAERINSVLPRLKSKTGPICMP